MFEENRIGDTVLLGVDGGEFDKHHDITASFIGGKPEWVECPTDMSASDFLCKTCSSLLHLVVQVYAPIDFHRSLHIFGCHNSKCVNHTSYVVIRSQNNSVTLKTERKEEKVVSTPSNSTWDIESDLSNWATPALTTTLSEWDDWSTPSSVTTDSTTPLKSTDISSLLSIEAMLMERDEVGTKLNKKKYNKKKNQRPTKSDVQSFAKSNLLAATFKEEVTKGDRIDFTSYIEPRYLDVINEPSFDVKKSNGEDFLNDQHRALITKAVKMHEEGGDISNLLNSFDDNEYEGKRSIKSIEEEVGKKLLNKISKNDKIKGDRVGMGGGNDEKFEKTSPEFKYFMNFSSRLKILPQQVLRYAYNGNPLWPNPPDNKTLVIPKCKCGATRVFELQLLPTILSYYETDLDSIDWASIAIYSCPESCSLSYEEFAYVQLSEIVDHSSKKLL